MRILIFLLLLTPGLWAQTSPETTVSKLYTWLRQVDTDSSKRLAEVKDCFTPQLYDQLKRAYALDPNSGNFLDFDPWSNSQMGSEGYTWGKAKTAGSLSKVPVTVKIPGGGTSRYTCVLTRSGDRWLVANLVYSKDFDLLSTLKEINK